MLTSESPLIPLALIIATYLPEELLKLSHKLLYPPKKKPVTHRWEIDPFVDNCIPTDTELAELLDLPDTSLMVL